MIQAEIGGAARITPGDGVQKPGFMVRDFTLMSSRGEHCEISSFRGRRNMVLVFPASSEALWAFVEEVTQHNREFSEQETVILVVVPHEEHRIPVADSSPVIFLYDETRHAYRLSGATDENGQLIPLIYLTDRFGEIVSTYAAAAPNRLTPPSVGDILSALEFVNHQCPECEPPEWPR